jgi:hypothetical protein
MVKSIFFGLILCLLLSTCTKDHTGQSTCTGCVDTVSFRANIIPIFNQNCATSTSCHIGSNAVSGHFNLDSTVAYAQATQAGTGYVVPGNPVNSILYDQLMPGANQHMPIGSQLDNCSIQQVYCWIEQGALNN